ncbi:hypothetical protein CUMW_157170 [Citrus unshiu]|nr:hypothetical protein CUMW_157170 [Citrus unshiu]
MTFCCYSFCLELLVGHMQKADTCFPDTMYRGVDQVEDLPFASVAMRLSVDVKVMLYGLVSNR